MNRRQQIAILGSTGSIGRQAIDVVRQHADRFEVYCLTANNQVELLAEQAREMQPAAVVIANEEKYETLKQLLADQPLIKVYAGSRAICDVVQAEPIDMVLTAMVGFAGLAPTIEAIKAGKKICLANKETLVVAGQLINELSVQHRAPIIPVDSEHSAIFQSLVGEGDNPVEKLLLTASGGPFRNISHEQLQQVTCADALRHPTWQMGAKITIDSATMMNKGFEVIEAKWLFGIPADRIQVLIHPQSVVHSAVQFADGAVKAQLGAPDMRVPIQLALSYPERLASHFPRLDWWQMKDLTFEKPDEEKFRCLGMAYEAIRQGGNAACIVNAANEVANLAFRQERCPFLAMADIIGHCLAHVPHQEKPSLDDYLDTDAETRRVAEEAVRALGL